MDEGLGDADFLDSAVGSAKEVASRQPDTAATREAVEVPENTG